MMTKEERKSRRQLTCKHFNGTQNECCNLKIKYDSVKTKRDRSEKINLPCIPFTPFIEPGFDPTKLCASYQPHTIEELEAEDKEWAEIFGRSNKAITAIQAHAGKYKKGEGKQGVIECPTCKGKLHYSRSGYNGHIHARCETKDCVSFMQ